MILFRCLGLAAALVWSAPAAAEGECLGADAGRFRLDLDWERATLAGEVQKTGPLFRASSPAGRAALPDCFPVAALDPIRYSASGGSRAARVARGDPPAAPAGEVPSWLRPFSFFVSLAGAYDSNINHDEEPLRSSGAIVGVGTRFETDAFEAEYEVASHSYTNTDRWDRISQSLKTSLEQRVTRRLSMEAVGEVTLKGSSEDRELGDQYILEPRIHYRFSRSSRLRLYGAHRLRRYDEDPDRDATNQYLGTEIRQRLGVGYVDFGYRWERNRSEGPRYRYRRQTYTAEYSTPLAGGLHRLALQIKYRPQQYAARFVDNEEDEGLRRDARWIFSVGGSFALGRHLELVPGYKFETRTSNDPEKEFEAHAGYLGLRYWFGKGGNPYVAGRRAAKPPTAIATKDSRPPRKLGLDVSRRPSASAVATKKAGAVPPRQAPPPAPRSAASKLAPPSVGPTNEESHQAPPLRLASTRNPTAEGSIRRLRFLRGSVFQCSGGITVPLRRAQVRLVGANSAHTVESSDAGAFAFDSIPAGYYELRIEEANASFDKAASRSRIDLTRNVFGYVVRLSCAPKAIVIR